MFFERTKIKVGDTEDPYFVALLDLLVAGLVMRKSPEGLWIIQIDNWFDHKWLRFSGNGTVDFQFPAFMNLYDAAHEEFYQDKLTFPPFNPNRVVGQWSFARAGDDYVEVPSRVPHRTQKQPSRTNLQKRIQGFARSACFIWYSSNTVANGRGSVMVYDIAGDRVGCWFAAFARQQKEWKLHKVKGVSREYVEELMSASS